MAGGRKISRENATAALSALLETIRAGGPHARCVTAVYVFGSYARGALTVRDVDVDIEYDARLDPAVERELIDRVVIGRDWNTPFRKALKPARALQVLFNRVEMIVEPVLVYERGDTLETALARVGAITPGPEAGRAARDPVHPAIEAVPRTSHAQRGFCLRSCSALASSLPSSSTWTTPTRISCATDTSWHASVGGGAASRARWPARHAPPGHTYRPRVSTSPPSR
jgi:hypothetical protein